MSGQHIGMESLIIDTSAFVTHSSPESDVLSKRVPSELAASPVVWTATPGTIIYPSVAPGPSTALEGLSDMKETAVAAPSAATVVALLWNSHPGRCTEGAGWFAGAKRPFKVGSVDLCTGPRGREAGTVSYCWIARG